MKSEKLYLLMDDTVNEVDPQKIPSASAEIESIIKAKSDEVLKDYLTNRKEKQAVA